MKLQSLQNNYVGMQSKKQTKNQVNFGKLVLPRNLDIYSGAFRTIEDGLGGKQYPPGSKTYYTSYYEDMLGTIDQVSGDEFVTVRAEAKEPWFSKWPKATFSVYNSNENGEAIGKRIATATFSGKSKSLPMNEYKVYKIIKKVAKYFESKRFK